MGKPNRTGRTKGGFVMVIHPLMESAAWHAASGVSIKLLLLMMKLSKGNNGFGDEKRDRGQLFLSERHAAKVIGVSKNTAAKAFGQLEELGFIRLMTRGTFDVKGLATTWRLTFQPYPRAGMAPTNEWRNWTPEEKAQAQILTSIGAKTDRRGSTGIGLDVSIEPIQPESTNALGSDTAPHIDLPRQGLSVVRRPHLQRGPLAQSFSRLSSLQTWFGEHDRCATAHLIGSLIRDRAA